MKRRCGLAVLLSSAAVGAWLCAAAANGQPATPKRKGPPDVGKVAEFMRKKLEHADAALAGLCTEDFEQIRAAAEKMSAMSQATEWVVIGGPQYAAHSREFRQACDQLGQAARNKNIDAAALAWLKVTMDCLECHRFVRKTRIAARPLPPDHRLADVAQGGADLR